MSLVDVKVPDVGVEGEVEVIEICIAIGDTIEVDGSIVVLESDKATVEVPSPVAGIVKKIAVQSGAKVSEGDPLIIVEVDPDDSQEAETRIDAKHQKDMATDEAPSPEIPESGESDALAEIEVRVPDLGGSDQVEVIEVSVSVGAKIAQEQALVVLESDKATMEIPSTAEGELLSLSVNVGDKVAEGDLIATLRTTKANTIRESKIAAPLEHESPVAAPADLRADKSVQSGKPESGSENSMVVHAGPAVRKMARQLGVDLTKVDGSGRKNRIVKEDLQAYIKSMMTKVQDEESGSAVGVRSVKLPDFAGFGSVSWQAMDKIQRLTAENMQTSWLTVPHVTQFDEADITNMEAFRKQQKIRAEERGVKLTPVAFLLKACAYALRELPQFNVSLDMPNYQIVYKDYVHIGLAVDTPGGLVVPVIRDVDKKNLWQLADECQSLALKARERKLRPAEMQGGCFTISSLGALGGTAFTPIVNTPEVAILGVSKAQYKPVFDGQEFIPRLMLPLSLSYDHRAVNGADAARFTSFLGRVLGDLRELLL